MGDPPTDFSYTCGEIVTAHHTFILAMRMGVGLAMVAFWGCNVDTVGTASGEVILPPSDIASTPVSTPSENKSAVVLSAELERHLDTNGNCLVTYAPVSAETNEPWSVSDTNPLLAQASSNSEDITASLPIQFRVPVAASERVVRVSLVVDRIARGDVRDGLERDGAGVRFAVGDADLVDGVRNGGGDSRWPKYATGRRRFELGGLTEQSPERALGVLAKLQCRIFNHSVAIVSRALLEVEVSGRTSCD